MHCSAVTHLLIHCHSQNIEDNGYARLSSPILPISSLSRIVTTITVLVPLSLVNSKWLLSCGVLPEQVSNTAYSGVARSKVIAVKVLDVNERLWPIRLPEVRPPKSRVSWIRCPGQHVRPLS